MNRSNGPISVVIPCYCCSDTLVRAVSSVQRQSLSPAEIILIDDASPDQGKTRKCMERILAGWSADSVTKLALLFLDTNVGPGGARNAGWDMADGKYVAFLDADDAWAPKKLEIQYQWMLAHPEFGLTCHRSVHIDNLDNLKCIDSGNSVEIGHVSLMLKNSIPTRSVMLLNELGVRFPPAMRYAEDYYLWLMLRMSGVRIARLSMPLAHSYKCEYGESGLSANLRAMHLGVLSCFASLKRKKMVSNTLFFLACFFEYVKYLIRLVKVYLINRAVSAR